MSIFKNRTVIGVICILLALVICFGITPLFNRGISQKAEIVRVTKDIHAGELITKDMVTTAEVGSYNLPSGLMTTKNNVVGKYAKADLAVGDYILAAKLSDAPAAENAYLYNLDGTKQAISVTIKSFATGLSGKLQSGDIVSVIVADYPEDGETCIPAELQYVEIISVTASTGYDANTGEAKSDEKELPSTVTFLVLPEQAKVLAELEQDAKLHLSLVYRGTVDGAKQFIETQDELIEAMISLARRTEADMASAPRPTLPALEPDNPASIPEANITIQEPEETQESSLHAMMKAWMTFALANVAGIILHISALATIVVLWLVWKNKRVVHLLPSEPDKRLGAPHGASQSRPVNYCMQDSRGPNSIGRRQMRQHMRDVS